MFNIKDKTILILIGIPASGKSTFYQQYFRDIKVISLDIVKTRNNEDKQLYDALNSQQSIVIDNTNITINERHRYINLAKLYHYNIVGIYFQSMVDKSFKRNELRENKVSKKAILSKAKQLEQPNYDEGFDELYYVKIENNSFSVSKWNENNEI